MKIWIAKSVEICENVKSAHLAHLLGPILGLLILTNLVKSQIHKVASVQSHKFSKLQLKVANPQSYKFSSCTYDQYILHLLQYGMLGFPTCQESAPSSGSYRWIVVIPTCRGWLWQTHLFQSLQWFKLQINYELMTPEPRSRRTGLAGQVWWSRCRELELWTSPENCILP